MVRTCRARSMLRRRRLPWRRAAAWRLWSRAGGGAEAWLAARRQPSGVLQRAACRRPPRRHAPRVGTVRRSLWVSPSCPRAAPGRHRSRRRAALSVRAGGAPLSLRPWLRFRFLETGASCRMHARTPCVSRICGQIWACLLSLLSTQSSRDTAMQLPPPSLGPHERLGVFGTRCPHTQPVHCPLLCRWLSGGRCGPGPGRAAAFLSAQTEPGRLSQTLTGRVDVLWGRSCGGWVGRDVWSLSSAGSKGLPLDSGWWRGRGASQCPFGVLGSRVFTGKHRGGDGEGRVSVGPVPLASRQPACEPWRAGRLSPARELGSCRSRT